jgi:hypothetical protein
MYAYLLAFAAYGMLIRAAITLRPFYREMHTTGLTQRQRDMLALVAQGHTYKEVAFMLNYSESTVAAQPGNEHGIDGNEVTLPIYSCIMILQIILIDMYTRIEV